MKWRKRWMMQKRKQPRRRGGGRGASKNGIYISDVTCYFEDSEWAALSNDTRKSITEEQVRTKFPVNKICTPPAPSVMKRRTRIS